MPVSSNRRGNGKVKPRARSLSKVRNQRTPDEIDRQHRYKRTFRMIEAIGPHPRYLGAKVHPHARQPGSAADKARGAAARQWLEANR